MLRASAAGRIERNRFEFAHADARAERFGEGGREASEKCRVHGLSGRGEWVAGGASRRSDEDRGGGGRVLDDHSIGDRGKGGSFDRASRIILEPKSSLDRTTLRNDPGADARKPRG